MYSYFRQKVDLYFRLFTALFLWKFYLDITLKTLSYSRCSSHWALLLTKRSFYVIARLKKKNQTWLFFEGLFKVKKKSYNAVYFIDLNIRVVDQTNKFLKLTLT